MLLERLDCTCNLCHTQLGQVIVFFHNATLPDRYCHLPRKYWEEKMSSTINGWVSQFKVRVYEEWDKTYFLFCCEASTIFGFQSLLVRTQKLSYTSTAFIASSCNMSLHTLCSWLFCSTITEQPFCNWTLLYFSCPSLILSSLRNYRDLGEMTLILCVHFIW